VPNPDGLVFSCVRHELAACSRRRRRLATKTVYHSLCARPLIFSPEHSRCHVTPSAHTPEAWPHRTRRGELNLLPRSGSRKELGEPVVYLEVHDQVSSCLVTAVPDVVVLREIDIVQMPRLHLDFFAGDKERNAIVPIGT